MELYPENVFHIYNRGNNRQLVFFNRDNYLLFLRKIREKIVPQADILAYCLMPNHFHLLLSTNEQFDKHACSNAFKSVLSSYTQAVNRRENRIGSLFAQNTKSKPLASIHAQTCFHYIHQNPLKANLVQCMEDWEFSSFQDYLALRNGTLCNQKIARIFLDLPLDNKDLKEISYNVIAPKLIDNIFRSEDLKRITN